MNRIPANAKEGVWTVVTRTSTYLIDFGDKTLLRAPGIGGDKQGVWEVSALRRDSEDIPLLSVETCEVGASAKFWVRATDDHEVRTWRITTPVVSIERIG